jgi:hypothetical protein
MHTLRFITGDSIFFPTLKQLATSPQYTYDNLVNTDDVERLFSKNSGINLKPLFDLCLRTTQKLELHITSMNGNQYKIQLQNLDMSLPVNIVTDKGTQRVMVDKKGIVIKSSVQPQIDPDMYYLKKLITE